MDKQQHIAIVDSWLKDISAALEIDLPSLDSEGICSFQIGEDVLAIEVSSDFPVVHLYSPLMALPVGDKDLTLSLLGRALELNAFQILTRGGAIASAPGGGFLIYCVSIPFEGADSERFSAILGAFFETLPELKKLLSESPAANAPQSRELPPGIKL